VYAYFDWSVPQFTDMLLSVYFALWTNPTKTRDIDQFLLFSILRIHLYKHHVILLFFCSTQSNYIHVVLYLHRYTIYIQLNYYITSNIESTKTVSTPKEKTDICHFPLLLSCTLYYLLKIVSKSKCFQLIILLGIKPYCWQ